MGGLQLGSEVLGNARVCGYNWQEFSKGKQSQNYEGFLKLVE